jgi:hypothetical protein
MALDDLDDLLDAPLPSGLGARAASTTGGHASRRDDPISFTLDPHDDDPSEAPALPVHRIAAARGPSVGHVAPIVRAVEVQTRPAKDENLLYVAMGLGIACTVLALAMLLAGGS